MKNALHATLALLFMALALPGLSRADVSTDVQALVAQADTLHSQMVGIQVTAEALCAPLVSANQGARAMVDALAVFNDGLAAPITLDETLLTGLADLALVNGRIGDEALRLTTDVQLLAPGLAALALKDGLTAMLQLADDIGAMADRIGEMADKILVMADNIGLMADRIIETQEIQSQNLALTQNSMLQSQTTLLGLVSVVETASYDLDLNTLVAQGDLLAAQLTAMVLNPVTIKYQLAEAAADVEAFKAQVLTMTATIKIAGAGNTMVIDDSTLMATTNMAIMTSSLATVLNGYNLAISQASILATQEMAIGLIVARSL
jgi:hypothetical protein